MADFKIWKGDGTLLLEFGDSRVELSFDAALDLAVKITSACGPSVTSPGVAKRSWTPEDDADLRRRYAAGETVSAIAADLARTDDAVSHRVATLKIATRRPDQQARMREYHARRAAAG